MKKVLLTIVLTGFGAIGLAQAPVRTSLYEGFMGENCPPSASTDPGLNALMANNANLVIPIKWEPPIPSAPTTTWSLYQTNKMETDWRWKPSISGGYGYICNSCSPISNYISWVPQGRMDGQELTTFGLTGPSANHPGNLTAAAIQSAQAQPTNFSIIMSTNWSPTYTNCVVTVTVTSYSPFTSVGPLIFRLCLVEKVIHFNTAPGSNQQKDFINEVRKSYPTTTNGPTLSSVGTPLTGTWTVGQSQTFSVSCNIPGYITNLHQAAFVGFIQDDGDRKVWQAAITNTPSISNDGEAISVAIPSVICSPTLTPKITIKNSGVNPITDMTVTPYTNAQAGTPVVWNGTLASGATTTLTMGNENLINGTNTYSFLITDVSGGDVVTSNNGTSNTFFNTSNYITGPINEGFTNPTSPPSGWAYFNPPNNPAIGTWTRSTNAGGFGTSSESLRLFINWTPAGGTHDLYLPGTSLTGTLHPAIKFDLSYTQISATTIDKLEVMVSADCGSSWNTVWSNSGASMATTPFNNSSMNVPTATQWSLVTVPLATYSNNPNVLVRFRVTSGQGNVIYLDNINLFNDLTTDIRSNPSLLSELALYPNPASNEVNIDIVSDHPASSTLCITNALGQIVATKEVRLNQGKNTFVIDTKSLTNGTYLLSSVSEGITVTKKLSISK